MYNELSIIKPVEEIESFFMENSTNLFFTTKELRLAEQKNKTKSLGARYLIKKLILEYLAITDGYKDIEIVNQDTGKPTVEFTGMIKKKIKELGIVNIQISISHSRNYITSIVILE